MSKMLEIEVNDVGSLKSLLDSWSSEDLLSLSEELLQTFIAANYAGHIDVGKERLHFSDNFVAEMNEAAVKELSFGLYRPYKLTRCKYLLWIAKLILIDKKERLDDCFAKLLWSTRCIFLWQSILPEPILDLKKRLEELAEASARPSSSNPLSAEFFLERMFSHLFYYEYERANDCLMKAMKEANISLELTGAFGRRTKFQRRNIPQLIVNTSVADETENEEKTTPGSCSLPLNVAMNDDTLLERVELTKEVGKRKLNAIQTACILATCQMNLKSQQRDELVMEKCLTYVDEVISQQSDWAIHVCALMLRSELEKNRRRRVERACLQAEVISKLVDGVDDPTPLKEKLLRVSLVLASGLQPFWRIHMSHAEILRSLGCTAEALKIYERLEDWDNVVDCYKSLGQLEKAEHIVQQLIEKDDSDPINYCLLGDITLQADCYNTAIKVSNGRCARAYKSLGNLMLIRNRFEDALENFKICLKLQPIQLGVWFNLGHCAWKLERFNDAANAYHRCVQLEPDHFEAWNNLAAAYIRLQQKARARRILQEALKFNYDHAKIWENYLLICIDTGELSQAIQAFHRLLDLKKKQEDDEAIEIMSNQIIKINQDSTSAESQQLMSEMCKLLGRLTASTTCSGKVWRCYAALKKPSGNETLDDCESYIRFLDRAFRADYNNEKWQRNEDQCVSVLEGACDVIEAKLNLSKKKETDISLTKGNARITLRPIISVVEREYGKNAQNVQSEAIQRALARAIKLLSTVSDRGVDVNLLEKVSD